jgi:C-terminal processing protease CtpA/Prc
MILNDSPAFRAGLEAGDVVLFINGQSTAGLMHEDVTALLRSDSGVSKLRLLRGQSEQTMNHRLGLECPANFVPVRDIRNWHERSLYGTRQEVST